MEVMVYVAYLGINKACLEGSDRGTRGPHLVCGWPLCLCLRECVMTAKTYRTSASQVPPGNDVAWVQN